MKRSVQNDTNFLFLHKAEFLYFVLLWSFLKVRFENLADFLKQVQTFRKALFCYVLYTLLAIVIYLNDYSR